MKNGVHPYWVQTPQIRSVDSQKSDIAYPNGFAGDILSRFRNFGVSACSIWKNLHLPVVYIVEIMRIY